LVGADGGDAESGAMSITIDIHASRQRELRIAARALDSGTTPVLLEIYDDRGDFVGEVTLFVNNRELAKQLAAAINAVMDAYPADDAPREEQETESENDE
jgi:hypothetical protein